MQIVIDENNVAMQCAIGCNIPNGIEVDNIPDEVFICPNKWVYADEVTFEEVAVPTIDEAENDDDGLDSEENSENDVVSGEAEEEAEEAETVQIEKHHAVYTLNADYVEPADSTPTVEEQLETLMAQNEYFDTAIAEIMLAL